LDANEDLIRDMVHKKAGWIMRLAGLDERLSEAIIDGLRRLTIDMAVDPHHPLREKAEEGMARLAANLQNDPETRAKVEELKAEIIANPAVGQWIDGLWEKARAGLLEAARNPDATLAGFRGWTVAVAEQSFAFLSVGARFLRAQGRGGTLVQVTGGSSRRGMPGRGLWAAGAFASRAMVQAAAQELREERIHVALLVVDATIASPKTDASTRGAPDHALADQRLIAEAVAFLAGQQPRAYTHELVLTPAGDRWVP
jgi:hypothetical protein